MAESPTELGSVHLSEEELYELESCLDGLSESSKTVFQIKSNGFPVSESPSKALVDHTFSQGESLAYDIRYVCDEGKLRIVANSTENESHHLYVNGDEEWENKAKQQITRFMDSRKNLLRSRIGDKKVIGLEVIFALALSYSLGLFLPSKMIFPVITMLDYLVLFISVIGLFTVHQRNQVYPYFSVSLKQDSKYPKLSPLIPPVAFVVGIILPTIL